MKPRLRPSGYGAAFAAGAVFGTLWDQLQVRSGALTHAHPLIFGIPWWLPVAFGCLGVALVWMVVSFGDPVPKLASARVALIEGVWFTGIYAITAFFDRRPWVIFIVLAIGLLARGLALGGVLAGNVLPALFLAIGGPAVSAMLAAAKLFAYRTTQIGPLPAWVPLLWASGFLFLLRLTEALLQRFGVRRIVEPATVVLESASASNHSVEEVTENPKL